MSTFRAAILLLSLMMAPAVTAPPARADARPETQGKDQAAKAVLELLGHLEIDTMGDELFALMIQQIMPMMRRKMPNLPDDAYVKLHEEMVTAWRTDTAQLLTANVQIYAEKLTPEEVAEMNAFYATTAGRKMLKVLPGLMQQSYFMGQQWVERLRREAEQAWMERMKREGYIR